LIAQLEEQLEVLRRLVEASSSRAATIDDSLHKERSRHQQTRNELSAAQSEVNRVRAEFKDSYDDLPSVDNGNCVDEQWKSLFMSVRRRIKKAPNPRRRIKVEGEAMEIFRIDDFGSNYTDHHCQTLGMFAAMMCMLTSGGRVGFEYQHTQVDLNDTRLRSFSHWIRQWRMGGPTDPTNQPITKEDSDAPVAALSEYRKHRIQSDYGL
jgi:hypothetical protein